MDFTSIPLEVLIKTITPLSSTLGVFYFHLFFYISYMYDLITIIAALLVYGVLTLLDYFSDKNK